MPPSPTAVPSAGGMPKLGLGTWENTDPTQCAESVQTALEMGYRHIDTAQIYGNEDAVGEGIEETDVAREDIFLATKVWISNLSANDVKTSTQQSLDRLGTEYIDLLYVHWPAKEYDPMDTLKAFESLYVEGITRNIGVSNFEPAHLERAREVIDVPIFANQVEMHPFLPQTELRSYTAEADIELVAYSPLARGEVLSDPTLKSIAADYAVSPAQVSLAWLRERGVTAIPKATGEDHIRDNWESLDLTLDETDIERIDEIERSSRKVHPGFAPTSWE